VVGRGFGNRFTDHCPRNRIMLGRNRSSVPIANPPSSVRLRPEPLTRRPSKSLELGLSRVSSFTQGSAERAPEVPPRAGAPCLWRDRGVQFGKSGERKLVEFLFPRRAIRLTC
jgi:hypothetical protein